MGIPWLMTWKKPHVEVASLICSTSWCRLVGVLKRDRAITGMVFLVHV